MTQPFRATAEDCLALQASTFHGVGASCLDLRCTPLVGSCCIQGACVMISRDECEVLGDEFFGEGQPCPLSGCLSCVGDDDGDGEVNIEDLLRVIGNWGSCTP